MGVGMYCFSRSLLRILYRFTGGLHAHEADRMPAAGPCIVACNHVSYLDPMVLGPALPRPLGFMARRTLFDNPFFGWLIRQHLAFPVDREGNATEALRVFGQRLEEGSAVVIFPEGTRSRTGLMGEIKKGVGMLAVRANAPVLPAYVWGTYQSWPRGRSRPRPHPFHVWVGEPVYPRAGLDRKERKAEQERVHEAVAAAMRALEKNAWEGHPPPEPLPPPSGDETDA